MAEICIVKEFLRLLLPIFRDKKDSVNIAKRKRAEKIEKKIVRERKQNDM